LEKGLIGAVPLVEDLFDEILVFIEPKADRALVGLHSRVAYDLQLHLSSILALPIAADAGRGISYCAKILSR
jgi:hypothetical protein